jgi:hypothetical protein
MGAPVAVHPEDITVSLPLESLSDLRATALCTHVTLSRVLSKIIKSKQKAPSVVHRRTLMTKQPFMDRKAG